ncbi:MAG: ABC transporter ATP-binding protein [Acidimicrobiia bacterium]|nr:ABC transporter ATP-binding protein [Acidimicrobiia bacterium]
MSELAIQTEALTKYYGSQRGVEDLDLEVRTGEVYGFLGPNGAGKTTTIRLLMDFIRPTRGTARVLGLDSSASPIEIHRRVGYLPGELDMYDRLTGGEMIRYFGNLRGFDAWHRVDEIAGALELDLSVKIGEYSSGNKQKAGLVQAFMHEPELLILDEPTNALDPLIQQVFYRMVEEVISSGRTVFLSSHILPEVERIADRVGIIRDGTLVAAETVDALKQRAVRRLQLYFDGEVDHTDFAAIEGVTSARTMNHGRAVAVEVEGSVEAVMRAAVERRLTNVTSESADLAGVFLAYYSGDDDAA